MGGRGSKTTDKVIKDISEEAKPQETSVEYPRKDLSYLMQRQKEHS